MIPDNITREHVLLAIEKIRSEGVPERRKSTKFTLVYEGKEYPPKYIISIANIFANNEELHPSKFSGGSESNLFLSSLGFKVLEKNDSMNLNYWVEKTIVKRNPDRQEGLLSLGQALWSPQLSRGGTHIYEIMKEPRPGDIVLHLVDNEAFVGVSIVDDSYDDTFHVPRNTKWDFNGDGQTPGYYIKLRDYVQLEQSLYRDYIFKEQRNRAEKIVKEYNGLFYASDLNLRQGAYLTKAPKELIALLDEIYLNKTGKHIPFIMRNKENIAIIGLTESDSIKRIVKDLNDDEIVEYNWTYRHEEDKLELLRNNVPFWFYFYITSGSKLVEYRGKVIDFKYNEEGYKGTDNNTYRGSYKINKIEKLEPPLDPASLELFDQPGTAHNVYQRMHNPDSHFLYVKNPTMPPTEKNTSSNEISDIELIQECHLLAGKNLVLVGVPGTGKTRLSKKVAQKYCGLDSSGKDNYEVVTANAEWSAYDVIGGEIISGSSGLQTDFRLGFLPKAATAEKQPHWVIIDELNRANIDLAFGEAFTLLDIEHRKKPLVSKSDYPHASSLKHDIMMPPSFRVLATMNSYDRAALFSLGYAFRRRFAFIELPSPYDESDETEYHDDKQEIWTEENNQHLTTYEQIAKEITRWLNDDADKESRKTISDTEDFEQKLSSTWDQINTLRWNPAKLVNALVGWITKEKMVGMGYAQTVDSIKYLLIYLSHEGANFINSQRALDQAFLAYILPQLEYFLPKIRRETITKREEDWTETRKLGQLKDKLEALGLKKSSKKIKEIEQRLKDYGEATIF